MIEVIIVLMMTARRGAKIMTIVVEIIFENHANALDCVRAVFQAIFPVKEQTLIFAFCYEN